MFSFINEEQKSKINIIKEKFDKYFTMIITVLWVLSFLWDLICLHCYWSDYMLQLYSCFFFSFMALYFIIPAKIPKIIIQYFGFIKTILGHSVSMIFFSLLFLGDKHLFHKLCSIFLFIGGVVLLCMELITPETEQGGKYYESHGENNNNNNKNEENNDNNENSHNDSNPPTKLDDDSQQNEPGNLNNFNNLNDNKNENNQDNNFGDEENKNQDLNEQNEN